MKRSFGCVMLVLVFAASCARNKADQVFPGDAQRVLAGAERFELLTIDPSDVDFDPKRPGTMHGYRVLGRAQIVDAEVRQELVKTVFDSVRAAGDAAACFNPRHAISAERGGKRVEIVICFECLAIEVWEGNKQASAHISAQGRDVFEEAVRKLGLPAATRPE